MHNTSIPLDLAFLDADGVILEILPLVPFEEARVVSKSDQVAFALEVNRDWFSSRGLKPGLKVKDYQRVKEISQARAESRASSPYPQICLSKVRY